MVATYKSWLFNISLRSAEKPVMKRLGAKRLLKLQPDEAGDAVFEGPERNGHFGP
jgi:hypothetical protein